MSELEDKTRSFPQSVRATLSLRGGFSRIEVICIIGIVAFALCYVVWVGAGMIADMREGDDSITVETAQTCAYTELHNECFDIECPGVDTKAHKEHMDAKGNKRAYFDKVANRLVTDRPEGYNEHEVAGSDGERFARGCAVVQVTDYNGTIVCEWVLGR